MIVSGNNSINNDAIVHNETTSRRYSMGLSVSGSVLGQMML